MLVLKNDTMRLKRSRNVIGAKTRVFASTKDDITAKEGFLTLYMGHCEAAVRPVWALHAAWSKLMRIMARRQSEE